MTQDHRLPGPIKNVRVPKSDVDAARAVAPPRFVCTENSRRFAVMGAAILEKMCRSGGLSVRAKRTVPYILDTARGKTAISVMVSTISGDPSTKHMIVPLTSLPVPPGVVGHVIVCAFVSKHEKAREENGGLNVKLAGWATAEETLKYARAGTSVATRVEVASVPVAALHPIQTLRHYLAPAKPQEPEEPKEQQTQGDETCENHASAAS